LVLEGGVDDLAGTGAGAGAAGTAGGVMVAAGVVDRFESPPPNAFLNLPLRPFFSGSTGVGVELFDKGEGRLAGVLAAALAIGPVWRGVLALEPAPDPVAALAYVLVAGTGAAGVGVGATATTGRSRSEDSEDRSTFLGGCCSAETFRTCSIGGARDTMRDEADLDIPVTDALAIFSLEGR